MDNGKNRHTIWLTDEVWEQVKTYYQQDDCSAQNEFVEKALWFYIEHLGMKNTTAYLPEVFSATLEDKLKPIINRIGSLLFKTALEQNMQNHLLTMDLDMNEEDYLELRECCIQEVKQTNGTITFEEVLGYGRQRW